MIENMTLRVPSLAEAVAAYHALGYKDAGASIGATIALSDPANGTMKYPPLLRHPAGPRWKCW